MMKIRSLLIAIPVLTLCIGCAKEPTAEVELPNSDLIPLNISGSISQVQTKATAEGFVDKDALGLFAVNYSDNNTVAGTLISEGNQADNVKYIFDETNQKWNPVKAVYYKDVNTNADLYVYYPFQSSINDVNSANFEVKQDQSSPETETELSGYEASDFLWGKASNITPSEAKVAISLSHKLSSVQVTLVEGTGFDESEFADIEKSLILTNSTRKATIDYATGEATPLGNPQLNGIVMCPQEDGSFRAIVIPQSVEAGANLFAITIGGTSYSFSQSAAVVYQAGKQMNVSITVNKKVPTGEYELVLADTQIVDWVEDRNTHGGEARQYFVVNVETPGTLGATIEAMGKNPAKIKNLKVTGQITTEDFYFMRDEMTILEAINLKEVKVKNCYYQGDYYEMDDLAGFFDGGYYDDIIPDYAFWNKSSLWYFVFPEVVRIVGCNSFEGTKLSGSIVLPEGLERIGIYAFHYSSITSISFPNSLTYIGQTAFAECKFLSQFSLPSNINYIGTQAFSHCSFNGPLVLPDALEYIGSSSFYEFGTITGDLVIPEKITIIADWTFVNTIVKGRLILNNVIDIGDSAFRGCYLKDELVIPSGTASIGQDAFAGNNFTSLILPESLKEIGQSAFNSCNRLQYVQWNEGLMLIGANAFNSCSISQIYLPSSIQSIESSAFRYCYNVSSIVSEAVVPPIVGSGAFDGVPKDNFTLEVPAGSVSRYQGANGWSDFRRISAYYDFSISRSLMRGLNSEKSSTYILRCPSGLDWSIESKPDWVTVSPDHGTGKTDVTVTFAQLPRTSDPMMNLDNIYEQIGVGRNGEIVFKLDDKDYTSTMVVEQYDSDYADGQPITLQTASKGNGIDIVFIGDGYDAKDIANGALNENVNSGYASFFDIEPYKTYKDYFNVYAVVSESEDSGIGTVNTVKDSKFGSCFTQNRILLKEPEECFCWAANAKSSIDFTRSLVILLQNAPVYEGVTMMYGDGSAIACCPISEDPYPYDFRGIIQHEAGGHGFGKLGDEYIYHNAYIQTCSCMDGCEHPQNDQDLKTSYGFFKSLGWYKNLSMSSDPNIVPWSHLLYNPQYSDYVDMFEGGYMHSRGMYRSEASSCMNNNIPYYSAISRQAIVERIMEYAGEEFTLEKFYAKDSNEFGTKAAEPVSRKYVPEQIPFDGRERNIPIYMGEHPEL